MFNDKPFVLFELVYSYRWHWQVELGSALQTQWQNYDFICNKPLNHKASTASSTQHQRSPMTPDSEASRSLLLPGTQGTGSEASRHPKPIGIHCLQVFRDAKAFISIYGNTFVYIGFQTFSLKYNNFVNLTISL